MKITEPDYTIFKVFEDKDPLIKIGLYIRSLQNGRVGIDRDAVLPLLQEHIRNEDEQLLELGNFAFDIRLDSESPMIKLFERQPGYLNIDSIEKKRYILSGNIRALRYFCRAHRDLKIVKALLGLLLRDYKVLFTDIISKYRPAPLEGVIVSYVSNEELKGFPLELKIKHTYLAVHLRASLIAVHELIAGCRISSYVAQNQISTGRQQELCFIKPTAYPSESLEAWTQAVSAAEKVFLNLTESQNTTKHQSLLPMALKTNLVINTNLLEWMQILKFGIRMGIESGVHGLILSIFKDVKQIFPDVFENIAIPNEN